MDTGSSSTRTWIAEESFRCVPRSGEAFTLHVRIGLPETVPADGDLAAYGRCALSLEPLASTRWIGGDNQFQALCLSIE